MRYIISLVTIITIALSTTSCARSPVGVRPEFKRARLQNVAVAPFYALGSFGLPSKELERAVALHELHTVEWLREQGFTVMEPAALRQTLAEYGALQDFEDSVLLRQSLVDIFEPIPTNIEVATLRRLASEGKLPPMPIVLGEVVYHGEALCDGDPDEHTPDASVVVHPNLEDAPLPHPCIVDHLHAKLVSHEAGVTMWYSRGLREFHVSPIDSKVMQQNIAALVRDVFDEAGNFARFIR